MKTNFQHGESMMTPLTPSWENRGMLWESKEKHVGEALSAKKMITLQQKQIVRL